MEVDNLPTPGAAIQLRAGPHFIGEALAATNPGQTSPSPFSASDLDSIQGLGIAGFKKDSQELIFVTFGSAPESRALVKALKPRLSNAAEVADFNEDFSEARNQHGEDPDLESRWVGLGITASGLEKLGANLDELPAGSGRDAFRQGMAARGAAIGDMGTNDPSQWLAPFRARGGVDALIVVAGDNPEEVDRLVVELVEMVAHHGGAVVFQERGATLTGENMRGHEHFGFKDGASQPAIQGYDQDPAAQEPPAVPGGEFVLGFPDAAGPAAPVGDAWRNGSYLVFRRLLQDVMAFRAMVSPGVPNANPPIDSGHLAAKMVGRWPSGAPLEKYHDLDPGPGHNENDFEYQAGDNDGVVVPTWAHIRKANPRDETQPSGSSAEDDPRRHRMLRRGSPFGPELPTTRQQDDGQERGLHFIAVVADVVRQFEFVQSTWMDNENFPKGSKGAAGGPYTPPSPDVPGDGPDPVVGEGNANKALQLHSSLPLAIPIALVRDVVRVSAGEYFFCPSLAALDLLGG